MSYTNKFYEDLAFELTLDNICFLVDEAKDIRRKHRNEVLAIPKQLLIVFSSKFLFIQC